MADNLQMFPGMPVEQPEKPKNIDNLYAAYGRAESGTCGECVNFFVHRYHDKRYFKCALVGVTHGPGTDWRKSWTACGKFEQDGTEA